MHRLARLLQRLPERLGFDLSTSSWRFYFLREIAHRLLRVGEALFGQGLPTGFASALRSSSFATSVERPRRARRRRCSSSL